MARQSFRGGGGLGAVVLAYDRAYDRPRMLTRNEETAVVRCLPERDTWSPESGLPILLMGILVGATGTLFLVGLLAAGWAWAT